MVMSLAASQPRTLNGNLNRVPLPSIIKGMESGGMIRCTQCGYKNSPVYHYCGVCGAVLQAPKEEAAKPSAVPPPPTSVPVAPAPAAPSSNISTPTPAPSPPPRSDRSDLPVSGGMSFLGLSDSSSSSAASYLLDDEDEGERSVAWGRILFVLILLGLAGGLGWQYHVHGYPFASQRPNQATASPAAPATSIPSPEAGGGPSTAAPTTATPSTENQGSDTSKPAESAASTAPESTPPAAEKTDTAPAETKPPAETAPNEKAEAVWEKAAPTPKAEKVAPARPKTPSPVPEPVVSPGESLYVQGQRYLYGNGVPPNCDLALKSLLSAASRQNSKAQSTLGAMYSTGHCVTRDLPTAYRWFAKALHQDPTNTRLEQDLSVVWKQMTPGERQSATRAE